MDFTTDKMTYYYEDQALGSTSFSYTGEWEPETETSVQTEVQTESETETEAGGLSQMIQNGAFADNKVLTAVGRRI